MKKLWVLALLPLVLSSCHVVRFFSLNFADVGDYKRFPAKEVSKGTTQFYFAQPSVAQPVLPSTQLYKEKAYDFETFLLRSGTVAFLMIRNDTLLYEHYPGKYEQDVIVPSFSVAKSFVSALIGIAIDEGYIQSVHDPVTRYLPELDTRTFGRITILHLLDMRSGIRFNEGYFNPFGDVAKYYYGTNLNKYVRQLKTERPPDEAFEYRSVNTQLLAMIISRATGKSVSQYLQDKIWSQLDMEYDASWSVDSRKHQTEKAFCCINARARDYARLGRLYLHGGNWNGKQIVSEAWVRSSVVFEEPTNHFRYSKQWWHTPIFYDPGDSATLKLPYQLVELQSETDSKTMLSAPSGDFYARGILGQYVYVLPEKNIIIVRLGKSRKHVNWDWLIREIALMN